MPVENLDWHIKTGDVKDLAGARGEFNTALLDGGVLRNGEIFSRNGLALISRGGTIADVRGGTDLSLEAGALTTRVTSVSGTNQFGTVTIADKASLSITGGTTSAASFVINTGGLLQVGTGGADGHVSGPITNHGEVTINRNGATAMAHTISGTGKVTVESGSLTLTAANTYTGATTIKAGASLKIGNGGTSGSITSDVTDHGELIFNRSDAVVFGNTISGTGKVTVESGSLTLTAANTYTGATTIKAGASLKIGNGGTSGSITSDVTDHGELIFNRSDAVVFGNTISGTGKVTVESGSLTLTAANTYTGATTIKAGASLKIGNGGTSGSITSDVTDHGELIFNRSDATTFAHTISGTGKVTVESGSLTLTAANTYTGTTTIKAGASLKIGNGGTSGSITSDVTDHGELIFNRSDATTFAHTISGTGKVTVESGSLTLTGNITATGTLGVKAAAGLRNEGSIGSRASEAGALTNAGKVINAGSWFGDVTSNSDAITNKAGKSWTGDVATSSGTLTNEAGATWTGALKATSGTLRNDGEWVGDIIQTAGLFTSLNGRVTGLVEIRGGTLKPGADTPGAALNITGDLKLASTSTYLITIDPDQASYASVTGTAYLNGAHVVINALPALNGQTYVHNKTYTILSAAALNGTFDANVTLQNLPGFTAELSYLNNHNVKLTLKSGLIIDWHIKTGDVKDLAGARGEFNTALLDGGVLRNGEIFSRNGLALISRGGTIADVRGGTDLSLEAGALTTRVTSVSGTNQFGTVTIADKASLSITGGTTSAASFVINTGGLLQVGTGGADGHVSGPITNHGEVTINRNGATAMAHTISGTGKVTVESGSLTLTAANTYTGATTIKAGASLKIGNGGTSGSITSDVTDHGELIFNRSDAVVFGNTISGTGKVTVESESLTLTAANTYTGATTIKAGASLKIGNGGTSGSITSDVTDHGELIFNRSDAVVFGNTISGTGKVTVESGSLTLTAANTYTGATTIKAGASLKIGNGGTSGSITSDVTDHGELIFNRSDATTFAHTISGTGKVTVESGSLTLTAANTYTGTTTIKAGASLKIGNGGTSGSITSDVTDHGELIFNRSDAVVFGNTISGTGKVTVESGSLTLTAANTYTGTTTIKAGASLKIGNGGTSGSITSDVTDHGELIFNRSDATTFAHTISGTGKVTVESGSLTLTGNITATGTLGVKAAAGLRNEGSIGSRASEAGALTNAGKVINAGSWFGDVTSNSDAITNKAGKSWTGDVATSSGTLTNEAGATWTGALKATSGTLRNDGEWVGDIIQTAGLFTSLNGRVTGLVEIRGGTLKPGADTPGAALNITGDLKLASTSTYLITIDPDQASYASVTGTAYLNGAHVVINALPALNGQTYVHNKTYTILSAAALNGTFDANVTLQNLPGFTAELSYLNNHNVKLTLKSGLIIDWHIKTGDVKDLAGARGEFNTALLDGGVLRNGEIFSRNGLALISRGGTIADVRGGTDLSLEAGALTTRVTSVSGTNQFGTVTIADKASLSITGGTTSAASFVINTGGLLQVGTGGADGHVSGPITNHGEVTINRNGATAMAHTISGTGKVTVESGSLTLTAANTYTGATTIKAGASLKIGNGGTSGSITSDVTDHGELIFNRSDAVVFGNTISGSGKVSVTSGTLTLSKKQSYSGDTSVSNATLNLTVAQAIDDSNSVAIKTGTLDLGGKTHKLKSVTLIESTLRNGTLADGTAITSEGGWIEAIGGTANLSLRRGILQLRGENSFASLTLEAGSQLSAAEIGKTLKVSRDVVFHATSTYQVTISPTQASSMQVDGTVKLNDAALLVKALTGTYSFLTQDYTIIQSKGGVQGTFSSVTLNGLTGFDATTRLSNDQKDVILNLRSNLAQDDKGGGEKAPETEGGNGGNGGTNNGADNGSGNGNGGDSKKDETDLSQQVLIVNTTDTIDHGLANKGYKEIQLKGGSLRNALVTTDIISTGGTLDHIKGQGAQKARLKLSSGTTTLETGSTNEFESVTVSEGATLINKGTTTDDLSNAGTVTNDFNYTATVAANTGTITNNAAATWRGNVTDNQGTLVNDGSWIGTISQSKGELHGKGTITGDVLINGGKFKPASAVPGDKMKIDGALTLGSNATYLVTLDPGKVTQLEVTGKATLDGKLQADFKAGTYFTKTYEFLTAQSITGKFTSLQKPAAMNAELVYDAKSVSLKLTADLAGQTYSPNVQSDSSARLVGNQLAVARALDSFFNNGGKLPTEYLTVYNLTGTALSRALAQLSGEVATGAQSTAFLLGERFLSATADPLTTDRSFLPVASNLVLWARLMGSSRNIQADKTAGASGSTGRVGGLVIGADHQISADRVIGFAVSGSGGGWTTRGLGTGTIESAQLGFYGRQSFDIGYLSAAISFAQHWVGTDRTTLLGNGLSADFAAQGMGARLEAGISVLPKTSLYAAAQGQAFRANGYSEKGRDGDHFGITARSQSGRSSQFELGARYEDIFSLTSSRKISVGARAAVAHSQSTRPEVEAGFTALPGSHYSMKGPIPGKLRALASGQVETALTQNISVGAKFGGEWSKQSRGVSGEMSLRITW